MRYFLTVPGLIFSLNLCNRVEAQNWNPLGVNKKIIMSAPDSLGPVNGRRFVIHHLESKSTVGSKHQYKIREYGCLRITLNNSTASTVPERSFLGNKVILDTVSGECTFYNYNFEAIVFNIKKNVGDTVLRYSSGPYRYAGVLASKIDTLIRGSQDSIQNIRLINQSTSPNPSLIHSGESVIFSKSNGILRFQDFLGFPGFWGTKKQELITDDSLNRMFGPAVPGFALEVGDILHYSLKNKPKNEALHRSWYFAKVISVAGGSVVVKVKRHPSVFYSSARIICNGIGAVDSSNSCSLGLLSGTNLSMYNSVYSIDSIISINFSYKSQYLFSGPNGLNYRLVQSPGFNTLSGSVAIGLKVGGNFYNWFDDTPGSLGSNFSSTIPVFYQSPSRGITLGEPLPGFEFINSAYDLRSPVGKLLKHVGNNLAFQYLTQPSKLEIFDLMGRPVLGKKINQNSEISIADLPNGLLRYRIQSDNGRQEVGIIVNLPQ